MEAAPPSYEHATLVDFWDIVARYIPSVDLCSASLVCSKWHATFAPHIWGNPASHFGIENDAVYVALTRFRRTLQTARLLVRSLTHTLHLPPAHAELYNGPHSDWLRDVMERLPNLQSLIVRGLPFFDYAALQALVLMRRKSQERYDPPVGVVEVPGSSGSFFQRPPASIESIPSFGLRLLDASRCPNVTSNGLAAALSRFESLLYLDLSFTYPAREPIVLKVLGKFAGLQVLKLRGVSLKDDNVEALSRAIGMRVRSLDIRDNQVTDRGVRTLLDHCFARHMEHADLNSPTATGLRSPTLLPYLGSEMLEIYQGEDFEGFLRNAFTGRFVSRLAIEDAPAGGITHLYIARNEITVEGLSGLIRSGRLHVLDAGSVAPARIRQHALDGGEWHSVDDAAGIEKLTPILTKHAAEGTTFLRIDHTLMTKDSPRSRIEDVVQGRVELANTELPSLPSHAAELDGPSIRHEAFELSAEQETPRYELEGDPMQVVLSPAADDTYKVSVPEYTDNAREARRGSALAPEVVDTMTSDMQRSHLSPVSALGENTMMTATGGLTSAPTPVAMYSPVVTPPHTPRPRSYSSMGTERRARLNAHMALSHNLHPAMLPHITTLVLTNVPPFSTDKDVTDRIIRFIKQCAEESALARTQAQLDYALPPGRKGHVSAIKHSANKLFALKRLVLEMAQDNGPRNSKASPWQHQETRSMTDDRDSEALWNAAATDFSFFGEEENMFPTIEGGRSSFNDASEKEVNFGQVVDHHATAQTATPGSIDTVAAISSFRKERKLAHDRQVAAGNLEAETEGLWGGVVQVVRSSATMRSDEEMDYYGNKFTNNYLYR
ncbi:Putative leucine-rich repeat domain superfamily [Septoria linicola]|uniref:Leucine-rich repeat domain superfamily n=1 Tax=Septoria linicola TaxID=215465 RepID=A0A9Q9B323_9PEZI|nr:putative leucine-rich repeat domain superfamily [Septoria linicola]USW56331.1 Putative leucine-rich repeat domain superfamily [Septoria linicola]